MKTRQPVAAATQDSGVERDNDFESARHAVAANSSAPASLHTGMNDSQAESHSPGFTGTSGFGPVEGRKDDV
jgi:hypothetical protein